MPARSLLGALDTEVLAAVEKFLDQEVTPSVDSLYAALQRSNSSLKRRPKKIIEASLDRVLDFIDSREAERDTDAEMERASSPKVDPLNKSLRANLAAPQSDPIKKRKPPKTEHISKKPRMEGSTGGLITGLSICDIGGMDHVKLQLEELLVHPLKAPQVYVKMNVKITKGILLHGPPGCGKTMIARAFAALTKVPFIQILGPSIVSGMSGESEKAVREHFAEARRQAPCIIFLDELDAIAPKRESSQSQMEKRIVAQLLTCMDDLDSDPLKPVIVLAATNRPDSLDPALRRGGRFDTEINIGVPSEQVREAILEAQTRKSSLAANVDLRRLAKLTAGFVGADLQDLVAKAGAWQLRNYFDALKARGSQNNNMEIDTDTAKLSEVDQQIINFVSFIDNGELPEQDGSKSAEITMEAFEAVLPNITPSSKREGFATIPDVSWNDVGALQSVRKELQIHVVAPITNSEPYTALGLGLATGVLLWGPPGCGKTLLAKAAAAESKANFISVKGPELLNKFVGESEAAVRRVFTRARSSIPCVIFFDELDALGPRRDDGGSEVTNRVVNTLLAELDGMNDRSGIWVIGATNRPDVIDDALLRPGRFGTPLFVDLPDADGRIEIFKALIRNKRVGEVDQILSIISSECGGYSGADLNALVREAGHCAVQREASQIGYSDFLSASKNIQGSVQSMTKYYALKKKFGYRH